MATCDHTMLTEPLRLLLTDRQIEDAVVHAVTTGQVRGFEAFTLKPSPNREFLRRVLEIVCELDGLASEARSLELGLGEQQTLIDLVWLAIDSIDEIDQLLAVQRSEAS